MDAKAEAEKRWQEHLATKRNHRQARRGSFDAGFLAGAVWALREAAESTDFPTPNDKWRLRRLADQIEADQ